MRYMQLFFSSSIVLCMMVNISFGMSGFDPNNMQSIQQELEEANRAIEEYVSSLSPEEQAEFNRSVDEMSQMFENMSEEEFASFLGEMFAEESMPDSSYFEPSMQAPQMVMPEVPVITDAQKKKVETIIKVLDDIIRQTNILFVQVNSSLEASKTIEKWAESGKIANWKTGSDWHNVKTDIEKFVQQLYKAQDKNLTTQEYKYILDLIEDEATVNNLIQLQTNLNASIPNIEISALDIKKLSAQTKNALRDSLQYYTEGLYVLGLPQAFDVIFEKNAPKDAKSKEEEETAEKRALDALRRPRTPAAMTSAGASPDEGGYGSSYGGGYDYSGYGGGDYSNYGGGYSSPYDYSGGYGGGDFGSDSSSGGSSFGGGSSGGGQGSEATPATGLPRQQQAQGPVVKDERVKVLIQDVQEQMKEVSKIISSNNLFSTIAEHVKKNEDTVPVNAEVAQGIADVNNIIESIKTDVVELQRLTKSLNNATKGKAHRQFTAAIEKPFPVITKLGEAITSIDYERSSKSIISPLKRWAYFEGDEKVEKEIGDKITSGSEKLDDLKTTISRRVSLVTLGKNIQELSHVIEEFKKSTEQPIQTIITQPLTPTMPPVDPAAQAD